MIYTVTLNPAIDYVVSLDGTLKTGSINRCSSEKALFGGKGVNVSRVLHELGVETAALGFAAGFTGDALIRGLEQAGLSTRFVRLERGMTRINVKVSAGEETEINGMGPVIAPADMERLYALVDDLAEGDMLVLSGSVPKGMDEDIYAKLMARVAERGVRTAVDASKGLLRHALRGRPFLIKPNHIELGELFGRTLNTEEEIIACAQEAQRMGAVNVLVSMASRGALLLDETGCVHRIGCPTGIVKSSVGAGDSMLAGFLAGWLQTGDYAYALRLGTACGSATAFSVGLADRTQIDGLMAQMDADAWERSGR